MKGLIPNRTFDFGGMSGSNLTGVSSSTSKTSSGKSENTTVGPQISRGIVQPVAGPNFSSHAMSMPTNGPMKMVNNKQKKRLLLKAMRFLQASKKMVSSSISRNSCR